MTIASVYDTVTQIHETRYYLAFDLAEIHDHDRIKPN